MDLEVILGVNSKRVIKKKCLAWECGGAKLYLRKKTMFSGVKIEFEPWKTLL